MAGPNVINTLFTCLPPMLFVALVNLMLPFQMAIILSFGSFDKP